jgi:hypothetical protein
MEQPNFQQKGVIFKNPVLQFGAYFLMILLMSNLNAIVDGFLHPEIPYFDEEHLIVGVTTGLVSTMLIGLVMFYARYLESALFKIQELEAFLPICANCKKIRVKDADNPDQVTWQSVEKYISEHTNSKLTHSICPECLKKLYPEFADLS